MPPQSSSRIPRIDHLWWPKLWFTGISVPGWHQIIISRLFGRSVDEISVDGSESTLTSVSDDDLLKDSELLEDLVTTPRAEEDMIRTELKRIPNHNHSKSGKIRFRTKASCFWFISYPDQWQGGCRNWATESWTLRFSGCTIRRFSACTHALKALKLTEIDKGIAKAKGFCMNWESNKEGGVQGPVC